MANPVIQRPVGSLDHCVDRGKDYILVDGIASKTVLALVGKLDMGMCQGVGPAGDRLQAVVAEFQLRSEVGTENFLQGMRGRIVDYTENLKGYLI